MPQVEVRLFATLRRYHPQGELASNAVALQLNEGDTVRVLLEALKVPADEAKQVFVNGLRQANDRILEEGDTVAVFPPIAGG